MKKRIVQKQSKQKALGAKKIALDEITENFLDNLQSIRTKHNMLVDSLSTCLGIRQRTVIEYEKRRKTPTLKTLIALAKILDFDISESINYKFFYKKIRSDNLINRIQFYGLTPMELSSITGYSPSAIRKTINLKHDASVICLHTILQALDAESESYVIREKLTKHTHVD